MTIFVPEFVETIVTGSIVPGVQAALLLLLLLGVKEVLRSTQRERTASKVQMLNIAIAPLLLLFLVIVSARLMQLVIE